MKSLGIIAARGASKRIPRKVLRPIAGFPMLAYAAGAALASRLDRVVLSTDDEEVAELGRSLGLDVPFLRPTALAADDTRSDHVLLHALDALAATGEPDYDAVALVQPSTPFLAPDDIDRCLDLLGATDAACVFTARRSEKPPEWMFREAANGEAELVLGGELVGPRQRVQGVRPSYLPSGAAWIVHAPVLRATGNIYTPPLRFVVMDPDRAIDIDEPLDLVIAEAVANARGFRPLSRARSSDEPA